MKRAASSKAWRIAPKTASTWSSTLAHRKGRPDHRHGGPGPERHRSGRTLQDARDRAYAMVDQIDWPQGFLPPRYRLARAQMILRDKPGLLQLLFALRGSVLPHICRVSSG